MAFLLFFTGRFVCTYLLKYLEPGKLLFLLAIAGMACALGTIFIQGMGGLYCLVATSFFMSAMFPTIYGVSLEGLKTEATKIGAAFLVMAIVGGALMPTFQGQILDWGGSGYDDISILGIPEVNFSFVLPLICFFYIAYYGYKVKSFPEPENVV